MCIVEPEATQDVKYPEEGLTPEPKHKKAAKEEFPQTLSVVKTEDPQTPPQSIHPWPGAEIPDKTKPFYMSIESPARGMHPSEINHAWRQDIHHVFGEMRR